MRGQNPDIVLDVPDLLLDPANIVPDLLLDPGEVLRPALVQSSQILGQPLIQRANILLHSVDVLAQPLIQRSNILLYAVNIAANGSMCSSVLRTVGLQPDDDPHKSDQDPDTKNRTIERHKTKKIPHSPERTPRDSRKRVNGSFARRLTGVTRRGHSPGA